MDARYETLCASFPCGAQDIDWAAVRSGALSSWFAAMANTPQNPAWHGEGDVWTHTKLVCGHLAQSGSWQVLPEQARSAVFLAALLHDIGKVRCTRMEDGVWISPNHTAVGARAARTLLWQELGLCGSREAACLRDSVCALIRYHTQPLHILERSDPTRAVIRLASVGEVAPLFSLERLALLIDADVRGRIAPDLRQRLDDLSLFGMTASEADCFARPFAFPTDASRYDYLSGRNILPGQSLYDGAWGQVVMLSGLPGTGKDTYVKAHFPALPVLSLDAIRRTLRISPDEAQGGVIQAAEEQARQLLRKKQPFVMNATNLSESLRKKWCDLFTRYGASVRIIYLETDEETRMQRNAERPFAVSEDAVAQMRQKLTPPMPWEARQVEWAFV